MELTKVFNYSISKKINNDYKTIYILCNKKSVNINILTKEFKKSGIPISKDIISILNKIITKSIRETMINIDNKFNVIISLFKKDKLINNGPKYLLSSMISNNIRNINLLLINEIDDIYYKFTEAFLIYIYNSKHNIKYQNFFINYLSQSLSKQKIQNIIFLTKSIFICKNNKINNITKLTLNPKIKINNSNSPYIYYNGFTNKQESKNNLIVLIGSVSVIYSVITMCSLLNKNINIRGYSNASKIPKNANIIYIKKSSSNNIKYSSNDKIINKLLDETIKLSIPIKFKKIKRDLIHNIIKININNECLAVRLLTIL
jgi:hypothetical protein